VVGVQWHPEGSFQEDVYAQRPVSGLYPSGNNGVMMHKNGFFPKNPVF
jgi:hypothetical protein